MCVTFARTFGTWSVVASLYCVPSAQSTIVTFVVLSQLTPTTSVAYLMVRTGRSFSPICQVYWSEVHPRTMRSVICWRHRCDG